MIFKQDLLEHTPIYICEKAKLKQNLEILAHVQKQSDCEIILALKGFAMFSVFPLIKEYITTTTASSLNEARLGFEGFHQKVHLYSPAYKRNEFEKILKYASHITFNSIAQFQNFAPQALKHKILCGLRINPQYSEVLTEMYDPCARFSRLGVPLSNLQTENIEALLTKGLTGIHIHNHCGGQFPSLQKTLTLLEQHHTWLLEQISWLNLGGGHQITAPNYDCENLCQTLKDFSKKHDVKMILELGEAFALNAGVLIGSVLDIVDNEKKIAILDVSASAHMPDVLEMPYRPDIWSAGEAEEFPYQYRLAGNTCLAGDVIGDYSFPNALQVGDCLIFEDMLHYTMVKNTAFNGVQIPSIAIYTEQGDLEMVRQFHFEDYQRRLS